MSEKTTRVCHPRWLLVIFTNNIHLAPTVCRAQFEILQVMLRKPKAVPTFKERLYNVSSQINLSTVLLFQVIVECLLTLSALSKLPQPLSPAFPPTGPQHNSSISSRLCFYSFTQGPLSLFNLDPSAERAQFLGPLSH